jgi:uncharacterized membrane protein YhiD involved in acid resistance
MAYIWVLIGIGVALGLLLWIVGLAAIALWFVGNVLLIPLRLFAAYRTPEGRMLWEAQCAALRAVAESPRGTPARAAALARYKELQRVPAWRMSAEEIRALLAATSAPPPARP